MNDNTNGGICRTVAGIASLSGTEEGHLMCDRPASHATEKTPGQVARDAYLAGHNESFPQADWGKILPAQQQIWERVAAAVIAAQHHDTQDHILWTRDDVQQTG